MTTRQYFALGLSGLLFATAAVTLIDFYRAIYVQPLTGEAVQFDFLKNQTFTQLTDRLVQREVIDSPVYWTIYARLRGADRRIQAGTYRIAAGTTLDQLLDDLLSGKTLHYHFTIYEGWRLRDILAAMRRHPQIVMTADTPEEIRTHLGIPYPSAEGWFYPETYSFEKNTENLGLFRQAYNLMQKKLEYLWENRKPDLPYDSPYEALILASIVEKETANNDEYVRIASVFVSRLEKGMLLQADPAVIYGLGEKFDGDLRKRDLNSDTPYNTYLHKGLPPTPIAMPSERSIAAVLRPEPGDDLYFVARGDGTHYFSKTYKEHQKAVQKYQLGK